MRKIDKGAPIPSFTEFVASRKPVRWEEAKDVSREWREYILEYEQHRMSGYTETPVAIDDSHIDHFRKRSLFDTLIFDWNNFIVDSNDGTYGAKYKDKYITICAENEKLINPVMEDAGRFFKYELNGKIRVASDLSALDQRRADLTIIAFNLNEGSLVERRRVIINTILDSFTDLPDGVILEALEEVGFRSVVEQLLLERKQLVENI